MILSFSTQLNEKPTYFVEKIWQGFPESDQYIEEWFTDGKMYEQYDFHPDASGMFPKIHTIREDNTNRWKPGMMIDFFINARKKDMFCFAPRIQVTSVQNIEIKHHKGVVQVYIDGEWYGDAFFDIFNSVEGYNLDLETLSQNDGFESLDDFFQYFDKDFKGKIIHWTDFKYK